MPISVLLGVAAREIPGAQTKTRLSHNSLNSSSTVEQLSENSAPKSIRTLNIKERDPNSGNQCLGDFHSSPTAQGPWLQKDDI